MGYSVSLATLLTTVRQRTNTEGLYQQLTDQELTGYINGSVADWNDVVRGTTWPGQYHRSQYQFTTTGTNNNAVQNPPPGSYYPLPKDFLAMTSVDIFISGNLVFASRIFQEEQRNLFRNYPVGWLLQYPIFYNIWGNNIVFVPGPQATFQVQLNYVPTAPLLFNPTDCIDSINGWEEYIVLDAGIKTLMKFGVMEMIPIFQQRLAEQKNRIQAMAPRRIMEAAEVVHEINADYDNWNLY